MQDPPHSPPCNCFGCCSSVFTEILVKNPHGNPSELLIELTSQWGWAYADNALYFLVEYWKQLEPADEKVDIVINITILLRSLCKDEDEDVELAQVLAKIPREPFDEPSGKRVCP